MPISVGKKILVTGAAGFVGAHLVRALRGAGAEVMGTVLHAAEAAVDPAFVAVDLADGAAVADALQGRQFDYVVHCAAMQPRGGAAFHDYYTGNVLTVGHVLDRMPAWGATGLITFSTAAVYGPEAVLPFTEETLPNPPTLYALSKLTADLLVAQQSQTHGITSRSLRMPSVFGIGHAAGLVHTYYEALKRGEPLEIFSNGKLRRSLLHVDDVCAAVLRGVECLPQLRGHQLLLLGSRDALSMEGVARHLAARLGSRSPIRCVPQPSPVPVDWDLSTRRLEAVLGVRPMTVHEGLDRYVLQRQETPAS